MLFRPVCVHVEMSERRGHQKELLSLRAFKQLIDSFFQYLSDNEEQRMQYMTLVEVSLYEHFF